MSPSAPSPRHIAPPLEGRTALVTGAQQGIGRATAIALADAGARVALNVLDEPEGIRVAEEIRARGGVAFVIAGDLARVPTASEIVESCVDAWGRLDILVNNAGVFPRRAFLDIDDELWDRVLAVNLRSAAFVGQAAARAMIAGGEGGSIVNLSSSAVRGQPLGAHYAASKAGVDALTRTMALELAPHGIRVNALAPGLTDTAQPREANSPETLQALAEKIPAGRMGTADEMGQLIALLASDAFAYVTGQVLHANGGTFMP
ncbi:SDR family NAD(P)-dependent oxidoreductase [Homoserinibacter sp. GY 40078]|uniref:SDR family NAD(P)-dependent oxidoreductase n=1 Tax=Homoserinibacter sp. GY 40078 TaxID=2603275 RepID=UPI0016501F1C|nr:SDR family NAD(P)-dependent oxidoreductase [Homoserinibacter sp. GY 40078]